MSIDAAIAQLEVEIAGFNQGTKDQPKDGSASWFMLRGLSVGLTALKCMKRAAVDGDPKAAERFFRDSTQRLKVLSPGDE